MTSPEVSLRLVPIGRPDELSQFQLVNDKRGGIALGILTITGEERQFITEHIYPSENQQQYRSYMCERLANPTKYSFNGKKLSTYSINEQLMILNRSWDALQQPPNKWSPTVPAFISPD